MSDAKIRSVYCTNCQKDMTHLTEKQTGIPEENFVKNAYECANKEHTIIVDLDEITEEQFVSVKELKEKIEREYNMEYPTGANRFTNLLGYNEGLKWVLGLLDQQVNEK